MAELARVKVFVRVLVNFGKECTFHTSNCAKSLQGEAPCGGAVYGRVDEMSPAPCPLPGGGVGFQHDWWKTRRTRKN